MSLKQNQTRDVLIDLAKEVERARYEWDRTEPDTVEEASRCGRYRGLREALRMFEDAEHDDLPEWSVGVENVRTGEWDWYYPRALERQKAVAEAFEQARDDGLGDRLKAYEVSSAIAVSGTEHNEEGR